MSEKNSSEFGAFLAGFVIGGLVGAATALILAPQSGSETRSQISNKGHDLQGAGSERVYHTREAASQKMHDYQARTQDMVSQAQDQARIVLDRGKKQANEGSNQVTEQLNGLQEDVHGIASDLSDAADGDAPA